jgi:hypothetical protein
MAAESLSKYISKLNRDLVHHVYAYSPDSAPPLLQLGHVCTMSTHDECVGVGGRLTSASSVDLGRWEGGFLSAAYTGDTADCKVKVLCCHINLPSAREVAIAARQARLLNDVRRGPISW